MGTQRTSRIVGKEYPDLVKETREGLYVDDLMTRGMNTGEVAEKKVKAIKVFEDRTFKLHKWHSNVVELEGNEKKLDESVHDNEEKYAKQQLGTTHLEAKLFGLPWNKSENKLGVVTGKATKEEVATTKEGAPSQLAKVYDPLGLVSPATLVGKMLYREMCETRLAWDGELPGKMKKKWENLCARMPERYEVRTYPISAVALHVFGDASKHGVSVSCRTRARNDSRSGVFKVPPG